MSQFNVADNHVLINTMLVDLLCQSVNIPVLFSAVS